MVLQGILKICDVFMNKNHPYCKLLYDSLAQKGRKLIFIWLETNRNQYNFFHKDHCFISANWWNML